MYGCFGRRTYTLKASEVLIAEGEGATMYAPVTTVVRHLFVFHLSACSMDKVSAGQTPSVTVCLPRICAWSSQRAHSTYHAGQRASPFERACWAAECLANCASAGGVGTSWAWHEIGTMVRHSAHARQVQLPGTRNLQI